MKLHKSIAIALLFCFAFPLLAAADPLEDAKTAIENKDFSKAHALLLPLVEEQNADALALLDALHNNANVSEEEYNQGLSVVMNAAKQGFKPARLSAFKSCLNLANQGDTSAMFNVGYMCLNDWGGEHNNDVCLKWLENAGKLGHEKSSKFLSKIYAEGKYGVTPDAEQAEYWSKLPEAFSAGVDGKWEGSVDMGMGGAPMDLSYNFKTDGNVLTGTTLGPGGKKIKIKDGTIDGINLSFTVESKFNGMKNVSEYTGMFLGDKLELSFTNKMGGGPASPPMKITVKRAG